MYKSYQVALLGWWTNFLFTNHQAKQKIRLLYVYFPYVFNISSIQASPYRQKHRWSFSAAVFVGDRWPCTSP